MNYNDTLLQNNEEKFTKVNRYITILVCIYFFLSFYETYLNQLIGPITKYLIIIVIISMILNNKKIMVKWYHISILLWFFLKFSSILWSRDYTIMRLHMISQIGMIGLFLIMTSTRYDRKFINSIVKTVLYTSASMGLLALFFSEPYHGYIESRQVLTLFGVESDPNNMAVFYMYGVSISLYYILFKKENIFLNVLIFIINTYTISLTGSRGGMVTFAVIILCFIFLTDKSSNKIRSIVSKILISISLFLILYLLMTLYLPTATFERIFIFESYEGGSSRDILWNNVWSLFSERPLFGAGWGAYYGYNGYFSVVHNTFLSILSDGGVIGFLLFFMPQIWCFKEALKRKKPLPIIILATGLIPSLFLDAINKRFFWNAIIIAFVLLKGQPNEEEL